MTKCPIMLLISYHMDQCTFMYKVPNRYQTRTTPIHHRKFCIQMFHRFCEYSIPEMTTTHNTDSNTDRKSTVNKP